MHYLDTAYLVRLYRPDSGWEIVRAFVQVSAEVPAACIHARTEIVAALHRSLREGRLDAAQFSMLLAQFESDCASGLWQWRPVDDELLRLSATRFRGLSATIFLRAADGLHLTRAAEEGCTAIHTSDRHMIAAAPAFGLQAVTL